VDMPTNNLTQLDNRVKTEKEEDFRFHNKMNFGTATGL
jgi:hypothetical protein